MFGIGGQELIIILVLALIILGPRKLPEIAKSLGRAMGDFQRATNDLKKEIDQVSDLTSTEPQQEKTDEKQPADQEPAPEQKEPENKDEDPEKKAPEKTTSYNPDEIEV